MFGAVISGAPAAHLYLACVAHVSRSAREFTGGDRAARMESGAPPYGARAGRHRRDMGHVHTRGRRATSRDDTTRARQTLTGPF